MPTCRRLRPVLFMALLFPTVSSAQSSVRDFRLGGSAHLLDEECIRLTPDQPYASGSAWFEQPIDLDSRFEMRVQLVLGDKDLEGADGIVFVFHPAMQTGARGEGMGFAGLVPSLGVEFDTYQNLHLSDPAADHVALMTNGQRYHHARAGGVVELDNLEDGARHPMRITWSPQSGLEVYLDDELRAAYPAEGVRGLFGEETVVYWGMTAGTGRLSNDQDVCIEMLRINT